MAAPQQPQPYHSVNAAYDHLLKVLIVGDSGVGKSSLMNRYVDDTFDDRQLSTIGVDFKIKFVDFVGKNIKLTIWDTAGQERFRSLTTSYYRGGHGAIFVYDVTRRSTLEHVKEWLAQFQQGAGEPLAVTMLVANKTDLVPPAVSEAEGRAIAQENSMLFVQTSGTARVVERFAAKTNDGVNYAFGELVFKILESPGLVASTRSNRTREGLAALDASDDAAPSGCCGA